MSRLIFQFGGGAQCHPRHAPLLGVKAARLHDMAAADLPVPAGFTISTVACRQIGENGGNLGPLLSRELQAALRWLEKITDRKLGDTEHPLLLAVRCSPENPVRGLMPTLLGIGVTPGTAPALPAGRAWLDEARESFRAATGMPMPDDADQQLQAAIVKAVASWDSPLAASLRRNRPAGGFLAIIVQATVIPGAGGGSGVAFTRSPIDGKNEITGEFFAAGRAPEYAADPLPLHQLRTAHPAIWRQLNHLKSALEKRYGDAQEFHFAIEAGRIHLLLARTANRQSAAAIGIAVGLAEEKIIDQATALLRIPPKSLEAMLHRTFNPHELCDPLAVGFGASAGAAVGKIAFDADEAQRRVNDGEAIILVRGETEPADINGMRAAAGILTSSGGMTSHAAVVARGIGKPCVAGAVELQIDAPRSRLIIRGRKFGPDDFLSINGSNGHVMPGNIPTIDARITGPLQTLLGWADAHRRLEVRANADTPADARRAAAFGAQGIGLCRTEHMFFAPQRIHHMREMILATDAPARCRALAKLLPFQRRDFVGLFTVMRGRPVTIRLFDPPLHEFLPRRESEQLALAQSLGFTLEAVRHRVAQQHEANPMLGHRGDRLAITYPEIAQMQVRAIIEAACFCQKRGIVVAPEIMIPLAADARELEVLKKLADETAAAVMQKRGVKVAYRYGAMIEVPRAALTAGQMARVAEFFSFGTNDLTQMTLGISRDDAGRFLPEYLQKQILPHDPFESLDVEGVGQLVEAAVAAGRAARPDLKCGVCGEHGGDSASIAFFDAVGLDYVSCSPFRVPIARLAAAQAAIRHAGVVKPVGH